MEGLPRYTLSINNGEIVEEFNESGDIVKYVELEPFIEYYEKHFESHEAMIRGYEEIILTLSTKGDRSIDDFDKELQEKMGEKGLDELKSQLIDAMNRRKLDPNILKRKNKEK